MASSRHEGSSVSVVLHLGDTVIGQGVTALLARQDGIYTSILSSHISAPEHSRDSQLQVIIADVALLNTAAKRADFKNWLDQHHLARLVLLIDSSREQDVRATIELGALGCIDKACSTQELLVAVQTVALGGRHISQAAAVQMAEMLSTAQLTTREIQVLHHLAQGCCNKFIAREMNIALGTVKAHVQSLREKLGAQCRTHAVSIATKRGLLRSEYVLGTGREVDRAGQSFGATAVIGRSSLSGIRETV